MHKIGEQHLTIYLIITNVNDVDKLQSIIFVILFCLQKYNGYICEKYRKWIRN